MTTSGGKMLPIEPVAGDGCIWDGSKWLKIAPGMESYAVVRLQRENDQLRADLKMALSVFHAIEAAIPDGTGHAAAINSAHDAAFQLAKYGEAV